MAFILNLVEFLLMAIVSLDTLGFVVQMRKNPNAANANVKDFNRLCFTWVFFFVLRALTCSSCNGYIGSFLCMLTLIAKAYISIPLLHGTEKLYHLFIEENLLGNYVKNIGNIVKERLGGEAKEKKD